MTNENPDALRALYALGERTRCVRKVELLPFRKLCQAKYDAMGIPFPFGGLPECGALPKL